MKRTILTIVAVTTLTVAPLSVLAASHEHGGHGGSGSTGSMPMNHDGMTMEAGMAMLGEQTIEGVKAMAHVRDVEAAMAKMGMKATHHFMVAFVDKAGKPVTEGTVAVKIEDPAGKVSEAVALPGMQGHFGADLALTEKGSYIFKVGSKLPDGVVRQYEFKYEVK